MDERHGYYFEDLATGMSEVFSKTITEADLLMFAGVSGDTNPIHLDEDFASRTMFESRIAHGMLTASLVSTVLGTRLPGPGAIYVSQSIRFLAPVRIGDTVIARAAVAELISRSPPRAHDDHLHGRRAQGPGRRGGADGAAAAERRLTSPSHGPESPGFPRSALSWRAGLLRSHPPGARVAGSGSRRLPRGDRHPAPCAQRAAPGACAVASPSGSSGSAQRRSGGSARRDQLFRGEEVAAAIDAVDRRQPAVPEVERREAAPGGVAAQDQLVVRVADARDLELEVVLVGPEPGHLGIGLRPARDRLGDRLGLGHGVVHRFEPQAAPEQRIGVIGQVARGEDQGIAGAAAVVDQTPLSSASPASRASSSFGTAPMPMTTRSAGRLRPS